ncbi:MAG: hypothetical protein KAX31_04025, partial [Thermoplasmata archaeon]|nr:hypothetical protein [Thermoplasmata archaeon]
GMDHKSFFTSVFARQKELNALTSHPKGERKKLVLRMLGIENIDEIVRKIREDLRHSKDGIESARDELQTEDGRSMIDTLQERLDSLTKEDKELKKKEAARKKELDRAETVHDKLRKQLDRLEKERDRRQGLLQERSSLDATLKALKERQEGLGSELKELEKLEKEIEAQRKKVEKTAQELEGIEERKSKAVTEEAGTRTLLGELGAEQKRLRIELKDIEASIGEISGLGPDSKCPTCDRKLGKTFERLLSTFEAQKRSNEKKQARLREQKEKADSALEELKARLGALDKRASRLQARLKDWELRLTRIERLPEKRKELSGLGSRLDRESKKKKKLEEKLASLKFDEAGFRKLKTQTDDIGRKIRSVDRELETIRVGRARLEERRIGREKELERLKALEISVGKKRKEIELLAHLVGVMDQFKRHLISRIRPALASISSELIADLTDSRYTEIELNQDYEISIRDGASFHNIDRFSGGESDLANLCLRLAISEVIAEKHGTSGFNFVVLDEIFGSQDAGRKRSLLATLSGLSNRFKQIFLITHVEDVKELMGNVVIVKEAQDGTSTAEVSA